MIFYRNKCKVLFYVSQSFQGDKIKEEKRVTILFTIFILAIYYSVRKIEKGRQIVEYSLLFLAYFLFCFYIF